MAMGKAKPPTDTTFGLRKSSRSAFQHKTIEHPRTNSSFVNASFNDYGQGHLSPLDADSNGARKSERVAKRKYKKQ